MKYIICIAMAILNFAATAQEENTKPAAKYQLKLYGLFSPYLESSNIQLPNNRQVTYINSRHSLSPTIALSVVNKKGDYHEVELTRASINEYDNVTYLNYGLNSFSIPISGAIVTESKLILRYEYIHLFLKGKKFQPAIGVGAAPYLTAYRFTPKVTSIFPLKERIIGLQTFVIPRLTYHLNKRFVLDLNVPLNISEHQFAKRTSFDPTVPSAERNTNVSSNKVLEDVAYVRLGIGIKL